MKIKTKKQLNLPQLIEWAWDNPLLSYGKLYKKDDKEFGDYVSFEHRTNEIRVCGKIDCDDTFTVEVEEDVTEDTEFKSMIEVTTDDLFSAWEHESISTWKNEHSKEFHAYIDGEFKCIWRDGKLVE